MLFLLLMLCLLLIIVEIITLYKANRKKELKIYIFITLILFTVSSLEYLRLLPRHLMKILLNLFIGNK